MKKTATFYKTALLIILIMISSTFYAQIEFDGDNCEPHPLSGTNHAFDDNDIGSVTATADIRNFWLDKNNGNLYLSFDRQASGTSSFIFYFNTDCSDSGDNTRDGADWAAFFTLSGNGTISDNKLYKFNGSIYADVSETFNAKVGRSICSESNTEGQFFEMEISIVSIGFDVCNCGEIDLTEGSSLAGGFGSAVKDLFDPTGFIIEVNYADASNNGPICEGDDVMLSSTFSSGTSGAIPVSYSWSSNGAATFNDSTNQNPTASNSIDGEIFTVSMTDNDGCVHTTSTTVNVNPLPIINSVTGLNPTIATCPALDNGSITIDTTGSNLLYSINNGADYQSSNIFNGLTSGTYQIVVKNSITNCLVHHTENVVLTNPICVSDVSILATTNASEPSTDGLFTLTLTNPITIDTEITYTITGTAANGTDYSTIGTTVTILANQNTVTIPVNVIDDDVIEATETVIITLISSNTLVTIDPINYIAEVTINDNDGGPLNGLVINDVTVNEGAGNATFIVTLTGNVQGGFTVDYATANNTATAGSDYTSTSGTLTFTGTTGETKNITVPITDDSWIEPTETFYVNLSGLSTTLIAINDNQGTGTIKDNDGDGENGIAINDVTVNEGAGNATFIVTLTGNVQGGFTVDYATANNTATAGSDYTSTSGTLAFTGTTGETHNIIVPITDDSWIEPTESFFVNLSELSTDLISIKDNQGTGVIIDNDGGPQNGLVINNVSVNEGDGNALFNVTLTGNVQGGFTVNYATANNSAIAPGDYTSTSGTLTFIGTTGETHTIVVPIIDDSWIEPTENFFVNLSNLSTTLIGINDNQGIGTITDNDGSDLNGLTINDVTVNENAGNATFTVTLTGKVQGGFTVNYATANNSAIAPGDYTSTSGTLTFIGTTGETHTIVVPIIDDSWIEPTENFFVNLSNLSTTLIGINDNQGIGTITDNDGSDLNGLTINDVTVNENAGNALFNVTLTGNVQGGFTVDYATANNSAIAPGDYTSTSGTLTFTGTTGETHNIIVPIMDDSWIEPTESFFVNLSGLSTTLIAINDSQGTGTITDNDGSAENGIVINDVTVNEGAGNATFNVTLTGNVQGGFTFLYATANNSAIAPGDYTSTSGILSFTGTTGETHNIIVPIMDDSWIEPTESFFVNLSGLSTTLIAINDSQGTGTITDNDGSAENGIVINDVTVNEGAGNATFNVTLTGNVQGGFTFLYATANNSAIAPGDYTSTSGTLTFTGTNNETKTITVPITDDSWIEPTESFFVNLSELSTDLISIKDNQGTGVIIDNDRGPQNGLVINNVSVNEGDGNAIFNVTLTGNVQGGFTVLYATANNSAIAPGDYASTSGTLTFTGTNNETKTITVPIIDDSWIEPTENFFVNLSNLSTSLIGINDNQGIGTIADNDGGDLNGIAINDVTVNEGDGNATFTVTLTGNVQGGFTVDFATANNSASVSGDYTSTIGTLTFIGTNGESHNIIVPIIDDNLIEPTENFFVNLNELSTELIGIIDGQGAGTIIDNDGGPQNGITINDVTVNESDGNATFIVTLTGNVQGGFTVAYATANESAITPDDYTNTNGILIFTGNNGETHSIIVPIIDDNLIEPTENFYVNLSGLSTTLIAINDSQGIGTITDNDGGNLNGLVINDITINEDGGNATFTVALTGNVQGGFTVDYATANNTATAGSDYASTSGMLTFTGTTGETKNITVPITDDSWIEPTENFYVNLSGLSTTLIAINDSQGTGTITDNDGDVENGIVINDVTVNEGAGNATFTVTLTGNVQGGFTVDYATANNSAIAPGDYTSTSGTLTFNGTTGETHNIIVPITDDNLIEPLENFFVNLSNLSTTLIGINENQGIGTISDNDGGSQNGLIINNITINENGGNATFTVTLTGNVQGGFTVNYLTASGSALATSDYTTTSGTLTFVGTTGETQTIVVPISNDNVIESTENFFVNLSDLSTVLIGINDAQGEGTIIDNDLNVNNDAATAIDRNPITINILANDSFGPDDTIVSVVVTTNPQHGTVTIDSNNNVIYTANEGYFGLDTFSYTLTIANTDNSINAGTATVTVTVNVSPNAADDLAETESNIPVNIDILANDTDADGTIDPTSVTIIEEPENGSVVVNTDGTVTYTPDLDYIGDDTFTYQVCDNDGLCDTATVNIVVAGVLAAELIIPQGFSPNDDGIHDEFDVEGLSNLYPDFKMVIYNRWGILVYDYTHNGNPLSEPIWWDGYSRGRMTLGNGPAPVGTYFYTLYFNKDGAKPRSGYLYLNR